MKILLISPLPPPKGGIANWTERFVAYCGQKGLECQVVNTALTSDRAVSFSDQKHLKSEVYRTIRILKDCRKKVRAFNPDIVHINSACSPTGLLRDYFCMLLIGKKSKIVLQAHCTIQKQLGGSGWALKLFRKAVKHSASFVVLNKASAEFTKKTIGRDAIIVPNFISDGYLINGKKIQDCVKKIVYTGHVVKTKGIDEILYAAEKLPDKQFNLLGSVSDEYRKRNIPRNIYFAGSVDYEVVQKYLDDSDIFILPTYTEGFSISLLEAMARGLPVITTDVGANADMIEDRGGIIVPVGDGDAVAEAVKYLGPPEKRAAMSAWNVEKTRENYLIADVVEKLIEIYKKVLDS